MRTTLAIADDVLRELKALSRARNASLTATANDVLRAGLGALADRPRAEQRYREAVVDMGMPQVDLTKALALAAELEDEEGVRKLQLRK